MTTQETLFKSLDGVSSVSLLLNHEDDVNKYWITIVSSKGHAFHSYMNVSEALDIVTMWNLNNDSCIFVKITSEEYL